MRRSLRINSWIAGGMKPLVMFGIAAAVVCGTAAVGGVTSQAATLASSTHVGARPMVASAPRPHIPDAFQTTGSNVNVRSGPGTQYSINAIIPNPGTTAEVYCYVGGEPVNGDSIWYSVVYPDGGFDYTGFVAGYWLNTGHDPNPAIPVCG